MLCVAPVSMRTQRLGWLDVTIKGKPNLVKLYSIGIFINSLIQIYVNMVSKPMISPAMEQIAI